MPCLIQLNIFTRLSLFVSLLEFYHNYYNLNILLNNFILLWFLLQNNDVVYVPHLLDPIVCWWTSRLRELLAIALNASLNIGVHTSFRWIGSYFFSVGRYTKADCWVIWQFDLEFVENPKYYPQAVPTMMRAQFLPHPRQNLCSKYILGDHT